MACGYNTAAPFAALGCRDAMLPQRASRMLEPPTRITHFVFPELSPLVSPGGPAAQGKDTKPGQAW